MRILYIVTSLRGGVFILAYFFTTNTHLLHFGLLKREEKSTVEKK